MTFDLVRWGWPNTAAVLALAAVPFMSMLLPAAAPTLPTQVEIIQTDEQPPIGIASIDTD